MRADFWVGCDAKNPACENAHKPNRARESRTSSVALWWCVCSGSVEAMSTFTSRRYFGSGTVVFFQCFFNHLGR